MKYMAGRAWTDLCKLHSSRFKVGPDWDSFPFLSAQTVFVFLWASLGWRFVSLMLDPRSPFHGTRSDYFVKKNCPPKHQFSSTVNQYPAIKFHPQNLDLNTGATLQGPMKWSPLSLPLFPPIVHRTTTYLDPSVCHSPSSVCISILCPLPPTLVAQIRGN